ncbi:MAG: ATPase, T2SS/T4P/T4SS family [Acidobacteriota bacterium]|nr:ATPase, T2SS/T4P/T4SS family [Acidobacteriota bacterium]
MLHPEEPPTPKPAAVSPRAAGGPVHRDPGDAPQTPAFGAPRAVPNPIPGLLALLRRQGRIPAAEAGRAAAVGRLPPPQHEAALVAEGILPEEDIAQAVALDAGLPFRVINPLELNPEVVTGALPAPFARRHTICALARDADTLTVAVANPFDRGAIADLERYLGVRVKVVVASRSDIEGINGSLYNLRTSLRAAETELTHDHGERANPPAGDQEFVSESEAAGDLEPTTRPVVAALDSILHQAFEHRASDIHLEPKRDHAAVRFRVDGVLRTMHTFPRIVYQAVVSRLKMLSGLDIAEKRRPQDGRIKRIESGKEIELRVSTLPTVFGEKAVLRVFDPAALVSSLEQLRLAGDEERRLRQMLSRREGLVLVTGPTGSGKTTTLYSVLRHIATPEVNVVTIEDPVELVFPPLSQVQVNPRIRFSFAAAIRSVLRQDPDILMVGEIRDAETAEMAVQAALTGHLVLSTLHTNDAPGAITRLADLGVPRFLIGSTLVGVVAQRLVRTICRGCSRETTVSAGEAETLSASAAAGRPVRWGAGCARCRDTGYQGRRAVFEILPIDTRAAAEVLAGCATEDLARSARRQGVLSLRQAAVRLLLEGETTVAEVIRVTGAGHDPGLGGDLPAPPLPSRRTAGSETERPTDHQEQRRDSVEHHDHVADRQTPVRHRDVRESARRRQRDLPDPGDGVDHQDPDQVEQEVDDRQLESPVGVGAGNREGGKERRDRRSHVRPEGDRKGVVEEQEPGSGKRDQHRRGDRAGLDEHGDHGPRSHGQECVTAEHPVEGSLAPARGNALQGTDEQAEGDHQQHHRYDGQERGCRLAGAGHDAGEPLDRHGDQLDDALEGTLVVDAGPEQTTELSGNRAGEARQEPGGDFERQEDGHRDQVEHVVAGGHLESPPQFLPVPEVSEGGDRVGDGRPDVGAHHHGDGVFERQRGLRGGDQSHDERTGDRGTLDQRRGQDSDDESHEGVRRSLEEAVEEPGAETLESLPQAVDRPQEEDEQQNQSREARQLGKPAPAGFAAGFHHAVPRQVPGAGSGSKSSGQPEGAAPVFRFVMDD